MANPAKITVLGSGSWGTALAHHLRKQGYQVWVWGIDEPAIKAINEKNENPVFFPGKKLAPGIVAELDLEKALDGAKLIVSALPSSVVRSVAKKLANLISLNVIIVSVTKGLEAETDKRMSEVLEEECGKKARVAVLSGPSFALEVLEGRPTAVTVAASDLKVAEEVARYFHFENFRIYTSTDVVGVELGGVLKNIMALAVGVMDGCEMGHNARAAVLTRGLSEMEGLVVALGGKRETVKGLSGLGDLLLTSIGDLSRNRTVGLRLGRGEKLDAIVKSLGQVAEAVNVTRIALDLAKKHNISVPIISEVDKILHGGSVKESVAALLSRAPKSEH